MQRLWGWWRLTWPPPPKCRCCPWRRAGGCLVSPLANCQKIQTTGRKTGIVQPTMATKWMRFMLGLFARMSIIFCSEDSFTPAAFPAYPPWNWSSAPITALAEQIYRIEEIPGNEHHVEDFLERLVGHQLWKTLGSLRSFRPCNFTLCRDYHRVNAGFDVAHVGLKLLLQEHALNSQLVAEN